jgi:hypothetical protein
MPDRPPVFAVALLPPGGQGTFATFDTERSAADYADRALPAHPDSRAWILLLEGGRARRLGVRGAGQWTPDRIPGFYVAPLAGGSTTPFHTYEEAREHASLGMVILSLAEDGGIWVDEF